MQSNDPIVQVRGRVRQAIDSLVYRLKELSGDSSRPLENEIAVLEKAARGEFLADARAISAVHHAIKRALNFFAAIYGRNPNFLTPLPDGTDFWETPEGMLIARAALWLYQENLIDQTEAARILFDRKTRREVSKRDLMEVLRYLDGEQPALQRFVIPGVRPLFGKRLIRPQVEELKRTLNQR